MSLISVVTHRFVDSQRWRSLESEDVVVLDDDHYDIVHVCLESLGCLGVD